MRHRDVVTHSLATMAAATALFSSPLAAQQPAPNRAVDSLFAAWNKPSSPGCALGVVRDGEFVYRANYGTADLERGIPIGARTAFYMASVSKQFAAAAVALAALQGKLSLDDDIRKYLPEMPDHGRPITVRNLVHHTSGIRDYLGLLVLSGQLADVHPDATIVSLIARQRALNFPTGTEYSYSNSGYLLLSVILQRATGMSLREFAGREIFEPLGMRDTYFYDDHNRPHLAGDRRALGYYPAKSGGYESGVLSNFEQGGDGGLFSTVEDVLRWDRNFYDGKVGGPRFLELIQTPGRLADGTAQDYAFGLMVRDYAGVRTVVHSGVFMGYRTIIQRFPTERFSVILLCNLGTVSPEELAPAIADIYLADRFQAAQHDLAGEYWSDEVQAGWRIRVDRGRVTVTRTGETLPLRSQGKDAYTADTPLGRANLKFLREGGRVTGLEAALGPRTTGVRFVKR